MNTQIMNLGRQVFITSLAILLSSCQKADFHPKEQESLSKKAKSSNAMAILQSAMDFELIWSDEFNTNGAYDANKWTAAPRGTVAWNKYMTNLPAYASLDGNNLLLRMDNAVIAGDNVPYHSGGVKSQGKFNLTYGKIEVRAKFSQGRGSWPAIWMMPEPETAYSSWPGCGEIDIMEHVNNESVVHQTIHNAVVTNANGGSTATYSQAYNTNDYNIYSIIWNSTSIRFYVNDVLNGTYSKAVGADWQQWPFDVPFYIILNQAGGAGWPGAITDADLPFSMQVDYVRVFKLPLFENSGFEQNNLSPWTYWGSASIQNNNARTGSKSIQVTSGAGAIEQNITGLTPNTTYRFGGFGKVSLAGESVLIGVKNYGGVNKSSQITSLSYSEASVTFTTGSSQTSATLFFYKPSTGTVYGDDFYFEIL